MGSKQRRDRRGKQTLAMPDQPNGGFGFQPVVTDRERRLLREEMTGSGFLWGLPAAKWVKEWERGLRWETEPEAATEGRGELRASWRKR